jgi:hypothetical protein
LPTGTVWLRINQKIKVGLTFTSEVLLITGTTTMNPLVTVTDMIMRAKSRIRHQ